MSEVGLNLSLRGNYRQESILTPHPPPLIFHRKLLPIYLQICTVGVIVIDFFVIVDGRLEKETQYTKDSLGEGSGTTNELLIHAANDDYVNNNAQESNILSVDSLQRHLKAVQAAIDVKVDIFGK